MKEIISSLVGNNITVIKVLRDKGLVNGCLHVAVTEFSTWVKD